MDVGEKPMQRISDPRIRVGPGDSSFGNKVIFLPNITSAKAQTIRVYVFGVKINDTGELPVGAYLDLTLFPP